MVTVYAKTEKQTQRPPRRLKSVALLLSVLVSFNAAADGLILPETLTSYEPPKKTRTAKPVEIKPVVAAKPVVAPVQAPAPAQAAPAPVQVAPAPVKTTAAPVQAAPAPQSPATQAPTPPALIGFMATQPKVDPNANSGGSILPAPQVVTKPVPTTQSIAVPAPEWRPGASVPVMAPQRDEPDFVLDKNTEGTEEDDDGDGASAGCDGSAKCKAIRAAGLNAAGKKIAAATPAATTKSQVSRSARLAQAAFYQANRCRDFADFKERRMGIAKYKMVRTKKGLRRVQIPVTYNSCKFFGKENGLRSKGYCARAVQEAFADSGIKIGKAHARGLRPNLIKAGFTKVKYNPYKAESGTVLVCNGGSSGFGHAEIVVVSGGERKFCSDFCSPAPTCSSSKGYSNFTAYSL